MRAVVRQKVRAGRQAGRQAKKLVAGRAGWPSSCWSTFVALGLFVLSLVALKFCFIVYLVAPSYLICTLLQKPKVKASKTFRISWSKVPTSLLKIFQNHLNLIQLKIRPNKVVRDALECSKLILISKLIRAISQA